MDYDKYPKKEGMKKAACAKHGLYVSEEENGRGTNSSAGTPTSWKAQRKTQYKKMLPIT